MTLFTESKLRLEYIESLMQSMNVGDIVSLTSNCGDIKQGRIIQKTEVLIVIQDMARYWYRRAVSNLDLFCGSSEILKYKGLFFTA